MATKMYMRKTHKTDPELRKILMGVMIAVNSLDWNLSECFKCGFCGADVFQPCFPEFGCTRSDRKPR